MTFALERHTPTPLDELVDQPEPQLPADELRGRVATMGETVNHWLTAAGGHSPDRLSHDQTQPDGTSWSIKDVAMAGNQPRSRRIAGRWVQLERRDGNEATIAELVVPFPGIHPGELQPSASLTRTRAIGGETLDISPAPNSHTAVTVIEKMVAELSGTQPAPRAPRQPDMRRSMRRSLLKPIF